MARSEWTRRDFFSAVATVAAVGAPAWLSACQNTGGNAGGNGNLLENARTSGAIKVGIAGEAPYGFTDESGKLTGEAPEVARAVFRGLGVDNVQQQQVDFKQLIPALNAQQYDLVAAGMNITPGRCENATFSVPDYSAPTAFLVPQGNPQQVTKFEDIRDKNLGVAVLQGAVEKDFAAELGVPEEQTQTYGTQDELLQAVTTGRAYCGALTNISLKWLQQQNPNAAVEVTPGFNPVIEGEEQVAAGGFVFRKDSQELVDAFNRELKKLHDNGQWQQIVSPFGFTEENFPSPELTTEKLCADS